MTVAGLYRAGIAGVIEDGHFSAHAVFHQVEKFFVTSGFDHKYRIRIAFWEIEARQCGMIQFRGRTGASQRKAKSDVGLGGRMIEKTPFFITMDL